VKKKNKISPFHLICPGIFLSMSSLTVSGLALTLYLLMAGRRVAYIHASMTKVQPTRPRAGRRRPGTVIEAMILMDELEILIKKSEMVCGICRWYGKFKIGVAM